jgi:hypothetical protein
MNKKIICIIIAGLGKQKTYAEKLSDLELQELKEIATLLKNEYGITLREEERDDIQNLFDEINATKALITYKVLENRPNFPIPDDLFKRQRGKQFFPPPKMGKISSKPKGKFRK